MYLLWQCWHLQICWLKIGLFRGRNHGLNQGWNHMSTKHEVPFIVTVVNDVPIKDHLRKWLSIPHITRRKISLEEILHKLTSNINLRMLWVCFSVDSILQKLESVAVSKKFLSSDLGLPTDFYSLGGNRIFSHFKRSAIFICPVYVAIQFKTDWEECWSESNSSGKCK